MSYNLLFSASVDLSLFRNLIFSKRKIEKPLLRIFTLVSKYELTDT